MRSLRISRENGHQRKLATPTFAPVASPTFCIPFWISMVCTGGIWTKRSGKAVDINSDRTVSRSMRSAWRKAGCLFSPTGPRLSRNRLGAILEPIPLNPLIPLIQWLNIFSSMMSVIRQPSGCSLAAPLTGIIALDDQEGDCYLTMQGLNGTVSGRWCSTVDPVHH